MEKQKSVRLNYLMNCILTASSMIFPLLSYPYVSRILQPEGMGKVAFANSIVSYFALVAMLGIPTYGIRACAKVRDDKKQLSELVWELLILNSVITMITLAVFGISIVFVPRFAQDRFLFLLMGSSILFQMLGVEWLFRALEEYTYITVRSLLFKVVALVLMFALVVDYQDYIIYGVLTVAAGVGSNICNFIRLHKIVNPMARRGTQILATAAKKHLKGIGIFFAMAAATTIYTNLDVAMLGFMSGDIEAGYYSSAVKIKGVLVSFVTALGGVLLPRLSYYIEQKKTEEFWRMIKKAFCFVAFVSVPLTIFFIWFAKYSILILSGESFLPAVKPMQIIMPTLILIGFSNICGIQILVPLNMEKHVLYSEIAGAVVDVIINIMLIPTMGAVGAALGTLIAEAVVLIYQVIVLMYVKGRIAKK
ncbi:MAG: flippase [Lachnospiraceae bacterium]|nr:flippase [Lachnospiraceae bacterium]